MTAKAPKRTFRFHVLGLAHLPVSDYYNSCAFTQKIHKLTEMIMAHGHEVILYGCEGSNAQCTEFVRTHTLAELRSAFGEKDYEGSEEIGYEWRGQQFHMDFGNENWLTRAVRYRTIAEIEVRKRPSDFLLLSMGTYHKPVADAVGLFLTAESGIGYYASYCDFRAFESASMRQFMRGDEGKKHDADGKHYYRVIPNYYRLCDFPFVAKPAGDKNGKPYFVFLARLIFRKGLDVAIATTKQMGARLIIAGQGGSYNAEEHTLTDDCGNTHELTEDQEFFGFATPTQRAQLLGNAVATFCPTYFLEPFCGVNVESQLLGTPVISFDYAAFVETIEHGRTGFRCHSLNDFVLAAKRAHLLDRKYIRYRAERLYSLEAVGKLYEKWFQDMYDVYESTLPPIILADGSKAPVGYFKYRTEAEEQAADTVESYFEVLPVPQTYVVRDANDKIVRVEKVHDDAAEQSVDLRVPLQRGTAAKEQKSSESSPAALQV